jgi:hypothetical protein
MMRICVWFLSIELIVFLNMYKDERFVLYTVFKTCALRTWPLAWSHTFTVNFLFNLPEYTNVEKKMKIVTDMCNMTVDPSSPVCTLYTHMRNLFPSRVYRIYYLSCECQWTLPYL